MRCKVGDLAVVVKSHAGHEGKILRCLRFVGYLELYPKHDDMWLTDRLTRSTWGDEDTYFPDKFLRPIRDNDGQDETLAWKALPSPLEIIKELTRHE